MASSASAAPAMITRLRCGPATVLMSTVMMRSHTVVLCSRCTASGVGGGSISSYGGNSHSRDGGHGGSVRMSAEGSILLNVIRTIGGDNSAHGSGSGGFGGDVSLSSNSGGISLLAGGGEFLRVLGQAILRHDPVEHA